MSKKCKNCGAVVEDTVKICPSCNNLGFKEISEIELSHDQIEEIAKAVTDNLSKRWRVLWGVAWRVFLGIFVILGIPGAITGWNIWSSLQGFERSTTNQMESDFRVLNQNSSNQIIQAYSYITNDVATNFALFTREASNKIGSAYTLVTNQIADEFQTPRIRQTVETVAKDQAKSILEGEVQPAVNSFREDASFIRTIAHAQAYDFKAYQRLLEIGTQTNDNARLANQVVAEIDRILESDRADIPGKSIRVHWEYSGTNFYKGPFTSDELAPLFKWTEENPVPLNREGFVNSIRDFKQPLFLPALIELFTNETDLVVANRLTLAISDLIKEDFHPHDFEQIQTWWRSHENGVAKWPLSEFNDAVDKYRRVQLSEAAKSFREVLKLDPSADMSRALAIDCYLELGNTNQAAELAKVFKDPTARWAQWAEAITELKTGSISNATVRSADLVKQNPVMIFLPQEGAYAWRNLDWALFHKLTSTEKQSP